MRHRTRQPLNSRNEAPRYTEDAAALEQLFRQRPDPWDFFTDPYESARLTHLQELVQQVPHRSVLEVGCAEGALTAWLTTVAEHVVALDISATACERARTRAPKATVLVENIGSYTPQMVFDLVVCAETLYYMRYPAAVLAQLHHLGTAVLVTYTRHERKRLDSIVAGFPPARIDETFVYTVRKFPPKKRACRCLLWGPVDEKPRADAK